MSVARHTVYNIVGAAIPIAVSLITVPLYLKLIGLERYGVLSICWLLVGYFNLFDFGLGRAISQKIATLAHGKPTERSRVFWAAALLSVLLCFVAMAVFYPVGSWALSVMQIQDATVRHEVLEGMPLLVAAIPFGISQSLMIGSLEGRREFFKINLGLICGTVATATLPLVAALIFGPTLTALLAAALIGRTLSLTILTVGTVHTVPLRRPRRVSKEEALHLLRFGGWASVSNIVGPVLVFVDRFAIGAILGTAAVALYVVPFNLVSQLTVLPAALASALFPRLALASKSEASTLVRDAVRALLFIITPASLLMLAGAGPFLDAWVGSSTSRAAIPVAYALIFGFWTNSLARIPAARLVAEGRPDLLAKLHLVEIFPYFLLLYFGMLWFGLLGAALAWSARCSADATILFILTETGARARRLLLAHLSIVFFAVTAALLLPTSSVEIWAIMSTLLALTLFVLARSPPPQLLAVLQRLQPNVIVGIDRQS